MPVYVEKTEESLSERRKEIKELAREKLPKEIHMPMFKKPIVISQKSIKEWLNQPHSHIREKNEMLLRIHEELRVSKYVGSGDDKHNTSIVMHLFEVDLKEDGSWIIVRELANGELRLHSISDNSSILQYIKRKPL